MKVSPLTLWLSAFGGAAAWTAALLIVPTLGSASCIKAAPHTERFGALWWVLVVLTAAAVLAACYALGVTVHSLRRAASSPQPERTRFMAFGGLLLNVVFLVSLAFFGAGFFLAPVCR